MCPACVAARMFESIFADKETAVGDVATEAMWLGSYELVERIGEGAFGEVFRAEQRQPVRRTVAVKVLKKGMDTRQVIARFEAERQALALMEHPHIAKVFDAGSTPDGRPFFVMEHVAGEPVTMFCNRSGMGLVKRLGIFLQVCGAVHHAHQKGVIHRDLKPSNILVKQGPEGAPEVKLIDFGIAQAVSQSLTDRTLFTRFHQVLGTPDYMSPEQSFSGGLDVDVRSDVYSLGAVLYQLLTGVTPFKQDAHTGTALTDTEIMRRQRDEVPVRPSTRCSTREQTQCDSPRHAGDHEMARALRGELDWIALKALAKRREDRYASAGELAEDISAYLDHRPVRARPPTWGYLVKKWARRHRAMAASLSIVTLGILASVVASMRWAHLAEQARARSMAAEQETRRAYSESDVRMGSYLIDAGEEADGVAHLCRALRTDQGNILAANYLVSTLAYNRQPQLLHSPAVHPGTVFRMVASADGTRVATKCSDGRLYLWNRAQQDKPMLAPNCNPHVFQMSPSGTVLLCSTTERLMKSWRCADGVEITLQSPEMPGDFVFTASDKAAILVAATQDGKAKAWSLNDGTVRWERQWEPSITCAAASPAENSGTIFAFGTHDGRVLLVNDEGAVTSVRDCSRSVNTPVTQLEWCPTGKRLAVVHDKRRVFLLNLADPRYDRSGLDHNDSVFDLAFRPDGRVLVTCGYDQTARLWDTATGRLYGPVIQHEDHVYAAAFSPDGRLLATASRDQTVQLHWVNGGRLWPMTKAIRHDFSVNGAAFVDDGQTLLTSSRDGVLRYWDLRRLVVTPKGEREPGPKRTLDGRAVSHAGRLSAMLTLSGHEGAPWHLMSGGDAQSLAWASDARVVMAWQANTVQCWRMDREKRSHTACGEAFTAPSNITAGVLMADAKHAVLACADGSLILIDPSSSALIKRVASAHVGGIETLMATLDGSSVISGGTDGMARIWAMPGLEPQFQPMPHQGAVTRLSISKDGQRLATACMDNSVRVWSLMDARPVTPPMRHAGHPLEGKGLLVTFDATGSRLLSTGSHDLTVRIWDSATGRELMTPLRHRLVPTAMAVSADDRWLATLDDKVSVWDLQSGLLVLRQSIRANIEHVCFDSDSTRLLMAAGPGAWNAKAATPARTTLGSLSVPRLVQPVPEWFLAFAEAKLGRRFGAANHLETVPFAEGARALLRAKEFPPGTDPVLRKWIQFLTTPPDQWPEWP